MFYGNTYQIVGLLSRTVDKFPSCSDMSLLFFSSSSKVATVTRCNFVSAFQLFKAVGERLQRRWLPAEVL